MHYSSNRKVNFLAVKSLTFSHTSIHAELDMMLLP